MKTKSKPKLMLSHSASANTGEYFAAQNNAARSLPMHRH